MAQENVTYEYDVDSGKFVSGVNKAEKSAKSFDKKLKGLGTGLKDLGKKFLPLTLGIGAFTAVSIKYLSDLQESQNVIDVTFGKNAQTINNFAKSANKSFGLSELQAKKTAGSFGAFAKGIGKTDDEVVDMATSLTALSADLASFYNMTQEEAAERLTSSLRGSAEAADKFNISMLDGTIKAYAMEKGLNKNWNALTDNEKAFWRYKYVMDKTKDAQGDFARTSDSFANQLRVAENSLKEVGAKIFKFLLPALTKGLQAFNKFLDKIGSLPPGTQKIIGVLILIAGAIGPVLIAVGSLVSALGAIAAVGAPVIAAIGLIIAGLILLGKWFVDNYKSSETFRQKAKRLGEAIKDVAGIIKDLFIERLKRIKKMIEGTIVPAFKKIADAFSKAFGGSGATVEGFVKTLRKIADFYNKKLAPTVDKVISFIIDKWSSFAAFLIANIIPKLIKVKDEIKKAFENVKNIYDTYVKPPFDQFKALLEQTVLPALQKVKEGFQKAFEPLRPYLEPIIELLKKVGGLFLIGFISPLLAIIYVLAVVINKVIEFSEKVKAKMLEVKIAWNKRIDEIRAKFDAAKQFLNNVATKIQTWWQNKINAIRNTWTARINAIKTFFNGAGAFIRGIATKIQTWWQNKINAIRNTWTARINAIKGAVSGAGSYIGGVAGRIQAAWNARIEGIKARWRAGINSVKSAFVAVGNAIKSIPGQIYSAFASKISALVSYVSGKLSSLKAKASSALRSLNPFGYSDSMSFIVGSSPGFRGSSSTYHNYYNYNFSVTSKETLNASSIYRLASSSKIGTEAHR